MITNTQIRIIHTLKNIIGMPDEPYRKLLSSFDVYSSKNLTETEANIVIECLNDKVKTFKTKKLKKYDDLIGRDEEMATPLQLRKIEVVWDEICDVKDVFYQTKRLRKFIKRQYHLDDIKFLSKKQATKLIVALEKIKREKDLKAI
jgi:hypothetical protein